VPAALVHDGGAGWVTAAKEGTARISGPITVPPMVRCT